MQIVINISHNLYESIMKDYVLSKLGEHELYKAVQKGTPLPERHSELVDKREVYKKFYNRSLAHVAGEILSEVTTIIPATKEVMYYPQVDGITPSIIAAKEGE